MTDWDSMTVIEIVEALHDKVQGMAEGFWQEEARRYAGNADYWRERCRQAELVVGEAAKAILKLGSDPTSVATLLTFDLRAALAVYDRWREEDGTNDRVEGAEPTPPGGPAPQGG